MYYSGHKKHEPEVEILTAAYDNEAYDKRYYCHIRCFIKIKEDWDKSLIGE